MPCIWDYLAETRRRFPDREAAVMGESRWTYARLHARALGLAERLRDLGVAKGDRVALIWENSPEYVEAYFAVMRLGAVLVGLNPVIDAHYLDRVFFDCRPAALIAQAKFLRRLAGELDPAAAPRLWLLDAAGPAAPAGARLEILDGRERAGDDALAAPLPGEGEDAMILYTSGTTGLPKGVTLTQRNLRANTEAIVDYLKLDERERVMVVLPFYYSYGHSLLISHAAVGGCLVIDNRFAYPAVILDTLERERVTGFPGVASTFNILMAKTDLAARRFPHLRYFTTAGGALSPAALARLRALLPGTTPVVMYGQTEATARLSYLPPEDLDRKPGSIGRGIPGVRLEVLDEDGRPAPPGVTGEIVASGDNIMRGYWNDPEETAKVIDGQGRLWTGDLARADEEGYLWVVGRKRDMIKSGAFRINPKEIEDLLGELEDVVQAAIVGLPDEILGERMVACVIRRDGAALDEAAALSFLKRRLPHWKQPQELRFLPDFPRTGSGKIQKHLLREGLLGS